MGSQPLSPLTNRIANLLRGSRMRNRIPTHNTLHRNAEKMVKMINIQLYIVNIGEKNRNFSSYEYKNLNCGVTRQ